VWQLPQVAAWFKGWTELRSSSVGKVPWGAWQAAQETESAWGSDAAASGS
jgi:hypothetical protein